MLIIYTSSQFLATGFSSLHCRGPQFIILLLFLIYRSGFLSYLPLFPFSVEGTNILPDMARRYASYSGILKVSILFLHPLLAWVVSLSVSYYF